MWISSSSAGAVIGPWSVGWRSNTWGSVFLLGVPVMGVLLILGPLTLLEYRDENAGRIDLASILLSLVAVLAVIYGLKQLALAGVDWASIGSVLLGLTAGVAFISRQSKNRRPSR